MTLFFAPVLLLGVFVSLPPALLLLTGCRTAAPTEHKAVEQRALPVPVDMRVEPSVFVSSPLRDAPEGTPFPVCCLAEYNGRLYVSLYALRFDGGGGVIVRAYRDHAEVDRFEGAVFHTESDFELLPVTRLPENWSNK